MKEHNNLIVAKKWAAYFHFATLSAAALILNGCGPKEVGSREPNPQALATPDASASRKLRESLLQGPLTFEQAELYKVDLAGIFVTNYPTSETAEGLAKKIFIFSSGFSQTDPENNLRAYVTRRNQANAVNGLMQQLGVSYPGSQTQRGSVAEKLKEHLPEVPSYPYPQTVGVFADRGEFFTILDLINDSKLLKGFESKSSGNSLPRTSTPAERLRSALFQVMVQTGSEQPTQRLPDSDPLVISQKRIARANAEKTEVVTITGIPFNQGKTIPYINPSQPAPEPAETFDEASLNNFVFQTVIDDPSSPNGRSVTTYRGLNQLILEYMSAKASEYAGLPHAFGHYPPNGSSLRDYEALGKVIKSRGISPAEITNMYRNSRLAEFLVEVAPDEGDNEQKLDLMMRKLVLTSRELIAANLSTVYP